MNIKGVREPDGRDETDSRFPKESGFPKKVEIPENFVNPATVSRTTPQCYIAA